jgi:predicted nucleic acid-binding protein
MKIGSNSRRIYWDTSVLIAWLTDERHWPADVLAGIQDAVYEVETYNAVLFTSSITRTEFFSGQLSDQQKQKYVLLMRRSNVREIDPHQKITTRASQIREHYNQKKPSVKITTPDAIHLATAINYSADEFQTLDGLEAGGKKKTKLLALNGEVGVSTLRIVHPYPRNRPPANIVSIDGPLFEAAKKEQQSERAAAKPNESDGLQADPTHPPAVPGSDGGRAQSEAAGETEKEGPKEVDQPKPCECGCGEYPKDPKSRFLPGHDLRKAYNDQKQSPP